MKYLTFSFVLILSIQLLTSSVYAQFLNNDILKRFYPPITGKATEVTPVATTTEPTTTPTETTTPETTQPVAEGGEVTPVTEPLPVEVICPTLMPPKLECPPDAFPAEQFDEKGCLIGYMCTPMIKVEPSPKEPETAVRVACPQGQQCPDGSVVACRIDNNNCICDTCPIKQENIPEGCWQEVEKETGFVKIVCEQFKKCPADDEQARHKQECYNQGGNPVLFHDPSGCVFYDCKFGERQKEEAAPNPIYGYEQCPSPEEIDMSIKKCNEAKMFGAVSFEGGCRVAKCVQEKKEKCEAITAEMRMRIEGECEMKGLRLVKDFDQNGCEYFACAGEEFCKRDLPKEAFDECRIKGGEMVVRRDDRGCVSYSNCVERGDEREIYVEPVERVPEPTELLSIAFKLEQLKIELDKLARQANDIADYYASVGSPDEHRFRRAASMFDGIKDKIDEIKTELRDKLGTLTPHDMEQVRFGIKSVKESLKDIVYVMLSNSDNVKEMIEVEAERKKPKRPVAGEEIEAVGASCGTDGMCFDRAIRVCKPVTFLPEGRAGPVITLKGLEGNACILHAELMPPKLPEGQGPPGFRGKIYMDCKLTKYALGVRGPEDIMPYCEGPMKEMFEKYGAKPPEGEVRQQFAGPGGCTSDRECRAYCEKKPDECLRWCDDNPGMCPKEAETNLRKAVGRGEVAPREQPVVKEKPAVQACVGCLNNGICDVGECSECIDCLTR